MILWLLSCQNLSLVPNVWNHSDCVFESPTGGQSDSFERRLLVARGIELHVALKGPGTGQCLPLVVIMPPGLQAGTKDIETDWSNALVELGYWVLHWDPRGRGESTGQEVANGPAGASDAAAVLRWASALPNVDSDRISLLSRSFGGALAAGALAQHADLEPNLWIDYESPGWLLDDIQYVEGRSRTQLEAMAQDAFWWQERSPAYWAPNVGIPYVRLQGLPDHAQGPRFEHAQAVLERLSSSEIWLNAEPWSEGQISETVLIGGGLRPDSDAFIAQLQLALQRFD